jgi:hypothetical protein
MGNLFATLIVKYTFGGFGANMFNPAAFGRIFVGVAFGSQLTSYLGAIRDVPSLSSTGQTITTVFNATYPGFLGIDLSNFNVPTLLQLYVGNYAGALGETSVILIVILGTILTILKAHNWRPTVFFLSTIFLTSFFMGLSAGLNPLLYALTFMGLGSIFFGGMFMLTDPVTSPTTNYGKALIGIVAGFVVVLIRTQTAAPEGVVYGIAVANLVSPFIDKYTVGLTNQFLKQRYAFMTALIVGSVSFHSLTVLAQDTSPSSSESSVPVVNEPFRTYQGQASSYAYDEAEEPMTVRVDVQLDLNFNIQDVVILEGASSLGGYLTLWNNAKEDVLDVYRSMSVKDILDLTIPTLPESLTVSGLTVTTDRLFLAVYDAVDHLIYLEGEGSSFACDDVDYCDELKTVESIVYLHKDTMIIEGVSLTGSLASTGSYATLINQNLEFIINSYLGLTLEEVIALNQAPFIEGFVGNQTGVTVSIHRIFLAILDALEGFNV